jgi:hypothetical protein
VTELTQDQGRGGVKVTGAAMRLPEATGPLRRLLTRSRRR